VQVNNFIQYLNDSEQLKTVSEGEIMTIVKEFPYCQTGQLMYAINLKSNNSILFEEQLKKAASICPDRTRLFEYIRQNSEISSEGESTITKVKSTSDKVLVDEKLVSTAGKDELATLEKEYLTTAISSTILLESEEVFVEKIDEVKEINLFNEDVSHSFSSWLKHYNGEEQIESKKERNHDIINKFIQEDPRIKPKEVKFYSPTNMARISVTDSGVVSETLAIIHVDQGNYHEAIMTYEKLSLKNPKKSSYFASQIKILKQKLK